ncbi:MAG: Gfo/Idh/MocA family oxidoreductase [FCB group bacterium]|jgi:predicted dehydrogenase|nr:Gfo/Idh/MocA family oxidoreductase [FCB group bacterium]
MENSSPSELNRRSFLKQGGALAAATLAGAALTTNSLAQDAATEGNKPMLRVAMLSGWHPHARGYAKSFADTPGVKLTAVWDEVPERGQKWAQELEVPFVADLKEVIAREDVDGVAVNAPTNRHEEIMVGAANAGKHIFTEKVMALTVDECKRIAEAVRKADVKFCISFPFRTKPETLYARKAVEEGLLGTLTFFRVRVAHDGVSGKWLPEHFYDPVSCGGGAMIDLGAHPMYLARWLGGQPRKFSSTFNSVIAEGIEDNAVTVVEFENKCIGVAETSFVSTASPFSLEMSGTEGSLFVGGPDEKQVLIRSKKLDAREWQTPELPAALPTPIQMWVDGIVKGTPIPFGLEEGIQLTEMMEYAYRSFREGKQVEIAKA